MRGRFSVRAQLFSWEGPAFRKVQEERNKELKYVKTLAYNIAAIMSIIWSA